MSVVTLAFLTITAASTVLIFLGAARRPAEATVRPALSAPVVSAPVVSAAPALALVSAAAISAAPAVSAARVDRSLRVLPQLEDVSERDMETELRRGGLSAADVRLVSTRAGALGVLASTMWQAIRAYGAAELAVAVAGDLSHEALLQHLAEGTKPDFEELAVFAALNGLEGTLSASAPRRLDIAGLDIAGLDIAGLDIAGLDIAGLEIHEPGTWPEAA